MIRNDSNWIAIPRTHMPLLQANDGTAVRVTIEQLASCNVLHCMSEHNNDEATIPLENVDGALLDWLHKYLTCNDENAKMELVKHHETPLDLVHLSNYLDIPLLRKHACMCVASVIRLCETTSDMQRLFRNAPDVRAISLSDEAFGASFDMLMAQVARGCVTPIAH